MKRLLLLLAATGFALALPVESWAQAGPARSQLENFSNGLETLRADFTQQVISNDGSVQDGSSGAVWLSRPHLFRWEYGGDFPEVVVADGVNIWIYDEMLEQVTVKSQSLEAVNSPFTLLTDLGQLEQQFVVKELGDTGELHLLELRARRTESEFERILLGLKDDSLVMMVMEDAFGLRTEVRFMRIQRNPELDPALFRFEPPDSADVIGDPQGGRGEQ
jgi:outer membrane lipoprotein carrier protein